MLSVISRTSYCNSGLRYDDTFQYAKPVEMGNVFNIVFTTLRFFVIVMLQSRSLPLIFLGHFASLFRVKLLMILI